MNVSAATRHLLINRPAPVSSKTGVCTSSYDRPQFSLVHLHCFPFAIPAEAFRAQRLKSSSDIPHHPIRGNPPEWMGRWIDRLIARSIAQSIVGRSVARSFDFLVARSIVRSLHRLVLFACCFFGFGDVRQEALWQDIYKHPRHVLPELCLPAFPSVFCNDQEEHTQLDCVSAFVLWFPFLSSRGSDCR